jgi:hemolysin activation/secretion protein
MVQHTIYNKKPDKDHMNNPRHNRLTSSAPLAAKLRWPASLGVLLGIGLTLSAGAQGVDGVSPAPKNPGDNGIITPETAPFVKVEDASNEAPKSEAPKPEEPKTEEAKPEEPKAEVPKQEAPVPPVVSAEEANLNAVLITSLEGLAFGSTPESAMALGNVSGLVATEDLQLLNTTEFLAKVANNYLRRPVTLASINALNREVVAYFKDKGFPVVDVIVPEQDITAGTLRFIVLQARLGEIRVEGNKWFSDELLASQIRTAPGAPLASKAIFDDLNWLNQNPFRRVGLVYARGSEVGTTDVVLQVEDRRPFRFYAGYENSGNKATGDNRWLAGVNWGNAFGLDHQFNYQFTMADNLDDFYAHSGSYVIPLPWRHTLTIYGAYANSSAEIIAGTLNADGESYSTGFRYSIPLAAKMKLNHELFFGYDYKFSSNALIFGPTTSAADKTEVSQFNLGYSANLRDKFGSTAITATGFISPGNMTPHNENSDFTAVGPLTSADYSYGRLTLERVTRLPLDFSLVANITGQLSTGNLLVSEQLGAGGYATLRGYDEREANAEEGFISSVEIRTPSIPVFSADSQLQLLAFWDHAELYRHDPVAGSPDDYFLSSAGVGLRYSFSTYLSLRADYGWQLKKTSLGDYGDSRGHVGVIVSY